MKIAFPSPLEIVLNTRRIHCFSKVDDHIEEYDVLTLDTSKTSHASILYPFVDSSGNNIDQNRLMDEELKVRLVKKNDYITGEWYWEKRTEESKKFFISNLKDSIASDLITNGIPTHHFYDEKIKFFFKTTHMIKKNDMKMIDLFNTPRSMNEHFAHGNLVAPVLSVLSRENIYFPTTNTEGNWEAKQLSNRGGATLVDEYYGVIGEYRSKLGDLMLDIHAINDKMPLIDIWKHIYGYETFVGETERIKF